jgi:hypothetical protein
MDLISFCFYLLLGAQVMVSAVDFLREKTTPALFEYEMIQLRRDVVERRETEGDNLLPRSSECKVFPGDAVWPSEETWSTLNDTLNGALLKPAPMASLCYNNTTYKNYSNLSCEVLSANWATNIER